MSFEGVAAKATLKRLSVKTNFNKMTFKIELRRGNLERTKDGHQKFC